MDALVEVRKELLDGGDVTHVLLSHLHFDHRGWNTREVGGKVVPTFPHARYFLNRGEVEHARRPNERGRASYMPPNWEPLFEAGVAELFNDEAEPMPRGAGRVWCLLSGWQWPPKLMAERGASARE